ncbi:MAG: proline--tRNA ligase [Promethearchaeia archaeon]
MTNNDEKQKALPSFTDNFSEWFNDVLFKAEIIDYRYNLKGCGVWLAYGYKVRRNVLQIMRNLLENTPIPHGEYLFPLLIPEKQFMKEAEHIKGFEDEVYWVTHGGLTPLDVKLALRPTSETAIYPMMEKWIRSHQDLPLKTYQIVNTFRYEGKNTRSLIRVREITTFKEAHTCHADAESCKAQIQEAIGVYKAFFDALGVPYVVSLRPKWDTFPGAQYSIAFDCIFPQTHKALQIGTVHNLGQTFAKTFDITYETVDGEQEYVFQTCYGISERVIAALVASHGDNYGIKLPSDIAPIQVAIVPIIFKKKKENVLKACNKIKEELENAGIKVKLDERDVRTGKKFYYWELRGIPLRIEIGPREVDDQKVCLVRRDSKGKEFVARENAVEEVKKLLDQIQEDMLKSANERHKEWILRTNDLREALAFIDEDKGIAEIPFCGTEECASVIEKKLEGLTFLGIPQEYLEQLNENVKEETETYCVNCSKPVKAYWRIGKTF